MKSKGRRKEKKGSEGKNRTEERNEEKIREHNLEREEEHCETRCISIRRQDGIMITQD